MINSQKPDQQETQIGTIFFLLWLFVLPSLIGSLPMPSGKRNFLFYLVSFLGTVLIFRRFLWKSAKAFLSKPLWAVGCTAVGFVINFAAAVLLSAMFSAINPDFSNLNDQTVLDALLDAPVLMTIGVVALVPVTEEALFRGLLFRTLYDRSPAAAYLVSMFAFALIHVMGYIGTASPSVLLISFIQYLPAGLCLCLAYRFGGTLFSSILLHAAINGAAILSMR